MATETQKFQLPAPVSAGRSSSSQMFAQHPPASATLCSGDEVGMTPFSARLDPQAAIGGQGRARGTR